VAWGSKLSGTENEELIVEASKYSPHEGYKKRPNDEEHLEIEMEEHACAGDVCFKQVSAEWPSTATLALTCWHEDFRARAPRLSFFHCLLVDNIPKAANVDDPEANEGEESRDDHR
jgi:hypothetical protein